jgi:hypothetical protein
LSGAANIDVPDMENFARGDRNVGHASKVTDKKAGITRCVRPYRLENKIDGAVITLVDIDGENGPDGNRTSRKISSRK